MGGFYFWGHRKGKIKPHEPTSNAKNTNQKDDMVNFMQPQRLTLLSLQPNFGWDVA
jgi:hypothetical protein